MNNLLTLYLFSIIFTMQYFHKFLKVSYYIYEQYIRRTIVENNNRMNNYMSNRMNTIPYRSVQVRTMNSCCDSDRSDSDHNYVIGMAYVPWQTFENVYDACKGLSRGTIFADLDKPFKGGCRS